MTSARLRAAASSPTSTRPAYLDPSLTLTDLSTGVNFASAGAGLDDLTSESARVLTIGRQVEMLEEYKGKLRGAMGDKKAEEIVNGAVVVVSIGSNDLMNNYYVSDVRRREYSLEAYHGLMLQRMKYFVERIYKLGGRRIAIAGLPPLGCLPFVMTLAAFRWDAGHALGQRVCVDQKNAEAAAYNARLQDLINTMATSFKDAKIAYADTYTPMLLDMMKNPSKYGFTEANRGCCGTGTFEMGPTCMFPFPTCPDPSKFMFWDSVHPTTATYTFLANGLVKTALLKITR
ncbi:GDSL esterase/lipase At2g31550-like [Asparagus officinalis]|uniref:GDSL esterase/lipase At2g31550-like n=1 Tax=Asparagus officinalis TaxID=4686 RepID=UPI00098E580C|nr:GDSL esterase/lipase At2g31550-like [Asparagus officinalis]